MTVTSVTGFDWDDGNRTKCQKHGVTVADIEAVFRRPHRIIPDGAHSATEMRFLAIGKGDGPRLIFVVFALREQDGESFIRPISARYMHKRRSIAMNKQLPVLTSDEDAERFLDTADLSEYDLSGFRPHSFEFAKKSKQVNMRMPEQLLEAVKAKAAERGISYQRFIRQTLEMAIHPKP